jgi:hypothetical protein
MNTEITTTIVTTRPAAGADGIDTNLTINWEGMTLEDTRALAQQALVVKLQAQWRKNGIPAGELTINAADYRPGTRATKTKPSIETMLAQLSPAEKQALVAKLLANA